MNSHNLFLLKLNKKLSNCVNKENVIKRILKDLQDTDIFKPLSEYQSIEDEEFDRKDQEKRDDQALINNNIDIDKFDELSFSEQRIRLKQIEFGITPDPMPEKNVVVGDEYGRGPIHKAVLLKDETSIVFYLQQGCDPKAKDNNGNTPYDLAILRGDKEMMALLEKLNAAF